MRKLTLLEIEHRAAKLTGLVETLEGAGRHERAERLDSTRRRLHRLRDARRLQRLDERRRIVADAIDRFEDWSDDDIRAAGGVVIYVDGHRIVGLTAEQAFSQYGRLKRDLMDHGIPDEMAEWKARDIALGLLSCGGVM